MDTKYVVGQRFVVTCDPSDPHPDSAWTNYCFCKHHHLVEVRKVKSSFYLVISIIYDVTFYERLAYECKVIKINELDRSPFYITHSSCTPKEVRKGTVRLYIANALGTTIDEEIQLAKNLLETEIEKAKECLIEEGETVKSLIEFSIEQPDQDIDLDSQVIYGSFLSKSGKTIEFNYM